VAPLIEMFKKGGIPVSWQVYPEANHDTSWWPEERARYEAFLSAHPRVAHPDTVSWETERTDRYNRFRWLVIDRLGKRTSDVALPDVNEFSPQPRCACRCSSATSRPGAWTPPAPATASTSRRAACRRSRCSSRRT
jgi:hypothetical protein